VTQEFFATPWSIYFAFLYHQSKSLLGRLVVYTTVSSLHNVGPESLDTGMFFRLEKMEIFLITSQTASGR